MEAYKFEATVKEDGGISIPKIADLAHQQVEVFVIVRSPSGLTDQKSQSIERFLNKWRGVLRDADPGDLKAQYLQEKYE